MPQDNIRIPESITLNGVTYSVAEYPELQQFIGEVTKVEKAKLYTQIEDVRKKAQELSQVQIIPNPIEGDNLNTLVERLKGEFMTKAEITEALSSKIQEVVQPLLETNAKNQSNEIEQYRQTLLKNNEGKCFPELVKGATREELDKSLADSIALRSKYAPVTPLVDNNGKPINQGVGVNADSPHPAPNTEPAPAQPPLQTDPTPAPIPPTPLRPMPSSDSGMNVKSMSMEDYAKQREALLHQVESMQL